MPRLPQKVCCHLQAAACPYYIFVHLSYKQAYLQKPRQSIHAMESTITRLPGVALYASVAEACLSDMPPIKVQHLGPAQDVTLMHHNEFLP